MGKRKTQKEVAVSPLPAEDVTNLASDDDGSFGDDEDFGSELEIDSSSGDEEGLPEMPSSDDGEQGGVDEDEGEDVEVDEELRAAIIDFGTTAARLRAEGGDEAADSDASEERPEDPGSDSSEDERPNCNTVGDVPLVWYKDEDHIGYTKDGEKIVKSKRKDKLDALLDRNDSKKAMRTIYDDYNDEEITLTKEELTMIMRIRKGQFPNVEINPFEDYNDYFSREREVMPINDMPEPKRRFQPSKWEEKKIVKLVRAIRKGWLKTSEQKQKAEEPPAYLLWADDNLADTDKTAVGLSYIPAAKPKLPGHAESYNPPKEYLPTEEEKASWELMDPEDRPKFVPEAFNSLREVPMYTNFIKEIFERCLDLYLCPRVRKRRMHIDPESLVPQLPKPRDLMPFPTTLAMKYTGHSGKVRSVAPDPSGQWLLSGSDDCTLKLWEVRSGRCMRTWNLSSPVESVAWCPGSGSRFVSAASGNRVVLLPPGIGSAEDEAAIVELLKLDSPSSDDSAPVTGELCKWVQRSDGGIEIVHRHAVKYMTWHARGDYFSSVCPTGSTQAVLVHQLAKRASQNPFRKNRGRVQRVAFHPLKPFFYVATQNHVRVYNLAKQALAKKLLGGSGSITSIAIHPSGDHIIVGAEDKRLAWYDLDLSDKPYRALRYHNYALRSVAFHRTYPLFASASDDATVHVFHGMVYSDLMSNPLIVPVKVLRGHDITDYSGVLDVAFHPTQPWLFSAGADTNICLFCN